MTDLPILDQRRIEATLLSHVYDTLVARHGEVEARAVIATAVARAAVAQGASFAARLDHPADLSDMAAILPLWTHDGALEIEVLAQTPDRLDFNVTRCRYAEMYRDMGLGALGPLLSCQRDGEFCTGFNPDITLARSQTIMQGASHCDFRYRLTRGPGDKG